MDKDFHEPAKFNMALATLERMNNLLIASTEAMMRNDWLSVYKIECELWGETRPYTRRKLKDKRSQIDDLLEEMRAGYYQVNKDLNSGSSRVRTMDKITFNSFIYGIREARTMIRDVMEELGLLMPKADDPRYAAYG